MPGVIKKEEENVMTELEVAPKVKKVKKSKKQKVLEVAEEDSGVQDVAPTPEKKKKTKKRNKEDSTTPKKKKSKKVKGELF